MYKKGVLEKITNTKALLLVGKEEKELIIPKNKLPKGVQIGDWLKLKLVEKIVEITIDKKETEIVKSRISNKMEKLRKKARK